MLTEDVAQSYSKSFTLHQGGKPVKSPGAQVTM